MSTFTERFLEVPIMNVNKEQEEIMGTEGDYVRCIMKINPRRIETYCETIPTKEYRPDNKIWTSVVMESGDSFIVRMTLEKFETLLNKQL